MVTKILEVGVIKLVVGVVSLLLLLWFLHAQNNSLKVTEFELDLPEIPQEFDGYRIVHLSDLHGKFFGRGQEGLIRIIEEAGPDLIVMTGDSVDRYWGYKPQAILTLIEESQKIAPIYLVTGNHEWRTGHHQDWARKVRKRKGIILDNKRIELKRGHQKIQLLGIDDPWKSGMDNFELELANLMKDLPREEFTILLSHRPELIKLYDTHKIDLVFSGHAHGGQFILPWIGGILAPHQGFFPVYTDGHYKLESTNLIVSRGLGNSSFPQRLFNRPQVIIVTLKNGG